MAKLMQFGLSKYEESKINYQKVAYKIMSLIVLVVIFQQCNS